MCLTHATLVKVSAEVDYSASDVSWWSDSNSLTQRSSKFPLGAMRGFVFMVLTSGSHYRFPLQSQRRQTEIEALSKSKQSRQMAALWQWNEGIAVNKNIWTKLYLNPSHRDPGLISICSETLLLGEPLNALPVMVRSVEDRDRDKPKTPFISLKFGKNFYLTRTIFFFHWSCEWPVHTVHIFVYECFL